MNLSPLQIQPPYNPVINQHANHKIDVLHNLINDKYERILCEKCMSTFFTNVYQYNDGIVLLEKRALGLEYFCDAIDKLSLYLIPDHTRIGVLDENDKIINLPMGKELFSKTETEYRYIYLMEKLEHLDKKEAEIFNEDIINLDSLNEFECQKALKEVANQFSLTLQKEIKQLFHYYKQHQDYILWDLHGDNLMKRSDTGEVLVLDPFAIRV
ncbi:MAG TPA: hypothetical protein ENJ51_09525 [Leucothrix mucor]|uniref:Uncharacterized protein n=1 Tax=Leucothrix mucor TaxID=45248 RepID=A0A7V2T404_LEUMU|nr:hypothetical protein [Leucothrix mucor]